MRGFRLAAAASLALTGLLLSACTASPAVSNAASARPAGGPGGGTADCDSIATCYTPQQLQVAYGIKPLLDRRIDGRGETVVLPELAEPALNPPLVSNMARDMTAFDRLFHLPAARMRVNTTLAGPVAHPWYAFGEEVLDVEMVHVIAPRATLVIDLVRSNALNNVPNAVAAATGSLRLALSQGGVVSISAVGDTGGEHCDSRAQLASLHAALRAAAAHQVTVVAASGDVGVVGEPCSLAKSAFGGQPFTPVKAVNMPAADPLVLGAGGTSLYANHQTGRWRSETGWGLPYGTPNSAFQASGGGFSRAFAKPGYQDGIAGIGAMRGVPDVSADANGHTGMAVAIAEPGGHTYIRDSGGTSASAPIWAGLIALADQYAHRHLGFVNAALYRIAASPACHRAFHDITSGNNTAKFPPKKTFPGYRAAPGWDPVTGLGSPDAQWLIPLLARFAQH
jgi:subtilase family serine protease